MSETLAALLGVLISAAASFGGVYWSNRKSQALIAYRLEQLEQKVSRHNNLVERMFCLEGRMTEAEHDIRDLKGP